MLCNLMMQCAETTVSLICDLPLSLLDHMLLVWECTLFYFYDTMFHVLRNLDVKKLFIGIAGLRVFCDSVLSLLYVPGIE